MMDTRRWYRIFGHINVPLQNNCKLMVAVLYFVDIAKELLMCRFLGNRLLETINLKVFIFSISELQSIIKPTHQPSLAYHPVHTLSNNWIENKLRVDYWDLNLPLARRF